jgi:hypothetical protein
MTIATHTPALEHSCCFADKPHPGLVAIVARVAIMPLTHLT